MQRHSTRASGGCAWRNRAKDTWPPKAGSRGGTLRQQRTSTWKLSDQINQHNNHENITRKTRRNWRRMQGFPSSQVLEVRWWIIARRTIGAHMEIYVDNWQTLRLLLLLRVRIWLAQHVNRGIRREPQQLRPTTMTKQNIILYQIHLTALLLGVFILTVIEAIK